VQDSEGKLIKPFAELQALCDTTILELTKGIAVRPDGGYTVLRYHHQG